MNNNIDKRISKTLHVSSDSHEHECNNDIKRTQSIQSENKVCTEFRTMYNNYQTITESETNVATNKVNLNSQNSNNSKLLALLAQYIKIFSKSKYDVDKV